MAYPLLLHGDHAPDFDAYEPFGEWMVPWRFASFKEEYEALRTGVGLVDLSCLGIIEATGADRMALLQRLLTNDLRPLADGHGCRAALLDANGKLQADLTVLQFPHATWLICDASLTRHITQTIDRYLFNEDVRLVDLERQHAIIGLQGPEWGRVCQRAFGAAPTVPEPLSHQPVQIADRTLRLARWSFTGSQGGVCIIDRADARPLWEHLREAGRPVGLRLAGWEALNACRMEAGMPWYGIDMDSSHLLPETGLERALASDTKGCYLGQEIVARMAAYGSASKQLRGLLVEGREVPRRGDRIVRGSEEVGQVTSATWSPALNAPLAFGSVKRGSDDAGTRLDIAAARGRLPAVVRPLTGLAGTPHSSAQ